MDKKVTVLTPNGRRHVVQVTSNTTLLQILEMTCEKFGYNSDEYCLKHHRKEVGLTQMFRFSGLPNNCLLEMESTDQKRELKDVDICLQLESGQRVQGKFSPTKSLMHVVEELCSVELQTFDSPVVLYMRQEIIGKDEMSKMTLKNLGITEGRAMIRLLNKKPEQLKEQANVYIQAKEVSKASNMEHGEKPRSSGKPKDGAKGGGFALTKDLISNLKKPITPDSDQPGDRNDDRDKDDGKKKTEKHEPEKPKFDWDTGKGQSVGTIKKSSSQLEEESKHLAEKEQEVVEPEYFVIGDRNAILYSLDSVSKDDEDQDIPDSFFELTVHDLKLILRDLKKISSGNDNEPLQTEKMREMQHDQQMLRKMGLYKNCIIRIQFPNRMVIQGMFNPTDTIKTVHEWLKDFLSDTKEFHLYTIPPKFILPLEKNLLDLDLIPSALIHFSYDDAETSSERSEPVYIKSKFLTQLTTLAGAVFAAQKFRNLNKTALVNNAEVEDMDIDELPSSSRNSSRK